MELLHCKDAITIERAGMRVDKEKEGTNRRLMSVRLSIPVPASMFTDLPELFDRIFQDAKEDDAFLQTKLAHEILGQRIACYPTAAHKNLLAEVEFADLRNFIVCRDPESGKISLAVTVIFDYTNSNSQAAAWVPTWIGNSFWWSCEPIQQQLDVKPAIEAIGADVKDKESEEYLPKPFKAGRKARFQNKPIDDNPNEPESPAWTSWKAGWEAGAVQ